MASARTCDLDHEELKDYYELIEQIMPEVLTEKEVACKPFTDDSDFRLLRCPAPIIDYTSNGYAVSSMSVFRILATNKKVTLPLYKVMSDLHFNEVYNKETVKGKVQYKLNEKSKLYKSCCVCHPYIVDEYLPMCDYKRGKEVPEEPCPSCTYTVNLIRANSILAVKAKEIFKEALYKDIRIMAEATNTFAQLRKSYQKELLFDRLCADYYNEIVNKVKMESTDIDKREGRIFCRMNTFALNFVNPIIRDQPFVHMIEVVVPDGRVIEEDTDEKEASTSTKKKPLPLPIILLISDTRRFKSKYLYGVKRHEKYFNVFFLRLPKDTRRQRAIRRLKKKE